MKKLGEWWYAYLVCRKYGLKWSILHPLNYGSYYWDLKVISVNPFRNNFLSVFMHEVGHHVHHRKVDYDCFLKSNKDELQYTPKGWSVYRNLEAEWQASRFSVKSGKGDKKFLTSCFNTYTGEIFKQMPKIVFIGEFENIVDAAHKGWLKINK